MGCISLAGSLMLTRKYITERLSFPGKYPVSEGPVNRPLLADWDLWTDASPSAGTKILRLRLRMTCPAGRKARNTAAVRRYIFIARRTIPQPSGCSPVKLQNPTAQRAGQSVEPCPSTTHGPAPFGARGTTSPPAGGGNKVCQLSHSYF